MVLFISAPLWSHSGNPSVKTQSAVTQYPRSSKRMRTSPLFQIISKPSSSSSSSPSSSPPSASVLAAARSNPQQELDFLTLNNVATSSLTIQTVKGQDGKTFYQLQATSAFKQEQEILSIPPKLCIPSTAGTIVFGAYVKNMFGKGNDTFSRDDIESMYLAIALMHEKAQGAKSIYASYLGSLPETLNALPAWTREELDLLKGSSIYELALDKQEQWKEEYERLLSESGLFSDKGSPMLGKQNEGTYSLEAYIWARSVADSYAFNFGNPVGLALVPGIDIVTHESSTANAVLDIARVGLLRNPQPALKASKAIQKNEIIAMRYPDDSNTDLLLTHGFLDSDVFEIQLDFAVSSMDPFADDKADILEQQKLDSEIIFTVFGDEIEKSASSMIQYVRLLCVEAMDAFLLEAVFRPDVWDFMSLPVSRGNEQTACDTIIAACDAKLDDLAARASTLETDISKNAALWKVQLAKKVVEGEKAVLEKLKRLVMEELNLLDTKEYYQERRLRELDLLRPVDESEIVDAGDGNVRRAGQAFDSYY